ncbi:DDE-type integrase/transposase/recombinase [Wolbachia endosymbiont (group A) of Conops quadrifasciatus]|uniref:DDE-type integrase/transposase/recombinase n=1 Tax=Wolbachia endosymbiont (group A) of Conops quadrifasciatus TaxID=3066143 RepID=UPI00397DB986
MSSSINKQLVIDSLLMAVNKRKPDKNLLLHSDQGSQYTSQGYQYLLSIKNILILIIAFLHNLMHHSHDKNVLTFSPLFLGKVSSAIGSNFLYLL